MHLAQFQPLLNCLILAHSPAFKVFASFAMKIPTVMTTTQTHKILATIPRHCHHTVLTPQSLLVAQTNAQAQEQSNALPQIPTKPVETTIQIPALNGHHLTNAHRDKHVHQVIA